MPESITQLPVGGYVREGFAEVEIAVEVRIRGRATIENLRVYADERLTKSAQEAASKDQQRSADR